MNYDALRGSHTANSAKKMLHGEYPYCFTSTILFYIYNFRYRRLCMRNRMCLFDKLLKEKESLIDASFTLIALFLSILLPQSE